MKNWRKKINYKKNCKNYKHNNKPKLNKRKNYNNNQAKQ